MPDQPNTPEGVNPGDRPTQGKLVLPAYPDQGQGIKSTLRVGPEQFIRRDTQPPPAQPLGRVGYFWNKDPAYKVLIIAAALVIVSGIVFTILGSMALLENANLATQNTTTPQNPPGEVLPSGTVVLRPTFPSPSGGSGSNTSSQPPAHSTPALEPTPPLSTLPAPIQNGSLVVAITNYPPVVANNSRVVIDITTNDLFAEVKLQVEYNVPPFSYSTALRPADGTGNAAVPWRVHVRGGGFGQVTATLFAIAIDPNNGQQSTSSPVEIQVDTTGGSGTP